LIKRITGAVVVKPGDYVTGFQAFSDCITGVANITNVTGQYDNVITVNVYTLTKENFTSYHTDLNKCMEQQVGRAIIKTKAQVSFNAQSVVQGQSIPMKKGNVTMSSGINKRSDGSSWSGGSGDTCSAYADYSGYSWIMFHSDVQCADCTDACYEPFRGCRMCSVRRRHI
jgi:hypothetical protein